MAKAKRARPAPEMTVLRAVNPSEPPKKTANPRRRKARRNPSEYDEVDLALDAHSDDLISYADDIAARGEAAALVGDARELAKDLQKRYANLSDEEFRKILAVMDLFNTRARAVKARLSGRVQDAREDEKDAEQIERYLLKFNKRARRRNPAKPEQRTNPPGRTRDRRSGEGSSRMTAQEVKDFVARLNDDTLQHLISAANAEERRRFDIRSAEHPANRGKAGNPLKKNCGCQHARKRRLTKMDY